ncbi:MAG: HYR domain-containing protein, partial [Bacteroidota bacterium]
NPGKAGAVVTFAAPTAGSSCSDIEIIRTSGLGSGDFFPVGTTNVAYMAIDGSNQIALCDFDVTVVDNEAPQITVNVAPRNLWPADNKMKEIKATVIVTDNVPGATAVLTSITCNQNANGDIAGATTGVFDEYFELRAKRDNGPRIYTVLYTATDVAGNWSTGQATVTVPTVKPKDIEAEDLPVPAAVSLAQNYPNPFNPSTLISFGTPIEQHVELQIFNAMGVPVRTLVSTFLAAGTYTVEWDGNDDHGLPLSTGVYLYMLRGGNDHLERKMILSR